ncbi:hypothetical protein MVEN_00446700 [Mycena venus]|uniref:DUF6535 domain-containing protein n=1 Tax=Mycena venus TaxID=2733690 RepID=A0A8H6YV08_9AGAR|nr:hypothetical protein MVEN_00446700 [Mycena venus]
MSNAKKADISGQRYTTSSAASKLWAVYISEAEKYDKSLVESWKSNMEGILIFAGLFSASLTAFIIESYKTLVPDSGDSTVQMLTQISQQLAAAANGSMFEPPVPTHFTPPTSAIICNALWFISLGLSLGCALIATLLEQWARDFLHRADMRSSPVIRARIFSYLYYGMKRFNMHTVVDIIPLLLHGSLVLFFTGLVAFLFPIHIVPAVVVAALLAIVVAVYSTLTILPLWYLDCPYRTPLSTAVWHISEILPTIRRRCHPAVRNTPVSSGKTTMVEVMSRQATIASPERTARDYRALVWTIRSLADDIELEPFLEGLHDVLWGPFHRLFKYDDHIQKIMRAPGLNVQPRIEALLRSCNSGLMSPEASRRRRITCLKALWAIASLQPPKSSEYPQSLDFTDLFHHCQKTFFESEERHYSISAIALMRWSTFYSVKAHLATLVDYLVQCRARNDRTPQLGHVVAYLQSLSSYSSLFPFPVNRPLYDYLSDPLADSSSMIIPELIHAIEDFCIVTPYRILFDYLSLSPLPRSRPYRWRQTCDTMAILPDDATPLSAFSDQLEEALGRVAYHRYSEESSPSIDDWNDVLFRRLCSFWRPNEPKPIPHSIIYWLNHRNDSVAIKLLFTLPAFLDHLLSSFPITLSQGPSTARLTQSPRDMLLDEVRKALWCVAWTLSTSTGCPAVIFETIFDVARTLSDTSFIRFSIMAIVKSELLFHLYQPRHGVGVPPLRHSLLPTETSIPVPPDLLDADVAKRTSHPDFLDTQPTDLFHQVLRNRIIEAKIAIIADFLDGLSSDFTPYKPVETLLCICATVPAPVAEIHKSYQIRLADALRRILDAGYPFNGELIDGIFNCKIFEPYFSAARFWPHEENPGHAWLQESSARTEIRATLTDFTNMSSSSADVSSAQMILRGLECLHPS